MSLKWGIVSTGHIAHDFVNSISTLPEGEHKVVAVAARNLENAKKFSELHDIPVYYEGYEQLALDQNIEVVYVASLTPQHYEISMLMLKNGKHVLCEKPMCMNEREAKKLIEFAESKKLFLMEALWSRFIPPYQYLKKRIDNGDLGEIKEVHAQLQIPLYTNKRLLEKEFAGGTVMAFGIYVIQAPLFAFKEYPRHIQVEGVVNEDGVDTALKAEMTFSGNRKGFIKTSFYEQAVNDFNIVGSKGTIKIHDPFWGPTHLTDIDGEVKEWPYPTAKHEFNFLNSCGLRYQANEVKKCIRAGLIESESVSHADSIEFHRISDELRRQLGVTFEADNNEY